MVLSAKHRIACTSATVPGQDGALGRDRGRASR